MNRVRIAANPKGLPARAERWDEFAADVAAEMDDPDDVVDQTRCQASDLEGQSARAG